VAWVTAAVRFRFIRNRLRIWHARGWFAPLCWDCRWLRVAHREGEFYAHDEPEWYFDECMQRGEPALIVPPPPRTRATGCGQTWMWDAEHGARRVS
jgi:hypothetical protein